MRLDRRVGETFSQHCQNMGLIQERLIEALLVYGLALDNAGAAELLRAAREWKARRDATDEERYERIVEGGGEVIDRERRRDEEEKKKRGGRKRGSRDP